MEDLEIYSTHYHETRLTKAEARQLQAVNLDEGGEVSDPESDEDGEAIDLESDADAPSRKRKRASPGSAPYKPKGESEPATGPQYSPRRLNRTGKSLKSRSRPS